MQRGVERAVVDLEHVVSRGADPLRHTEAVHGAPRERLENHDIERALEEIEVGRRAVGRAGGRHGYPRMMRGVSIDYPHMSRGARGSFYPSAGPGGWVI